MMTHVRFQATPSCHIGEPNADRDYIIRLDDIRGMSRRTDRNGVLHVKIHMTTRNSFTVTGPGAASAFDQFALASGVSTPDDPPSQES